MQEDTVKHHVSEILRKLHERYDFGAGGDNGVTYYMDALWDSITYP